MKYLSEILACQKLKGPVKLYIDTTASPIYRYIAENLCENITKALQKRNIRAYLSRYRGFGGKDIKYADKNPDIGTRAHEEWHRFVKAKNLSSDAGEFIEEATSFVIDDIETSDYSKHIGLSKNFIIPTYLLVQNSEESEIEKILTEFDQFSHRMPDWNGQVMEGSCPWLKFIEDARYFMLYDLCFDIAINNGKISAKKIYIEALRITKWKGIKEGILYLREYASKKISNLYDFKFDVDRYFPSYMPYKYPSLHYRFFDGKIEIEAFSAYKTWFQPIEMEIKKLELKQS